MRILLIFLFFMSCTTTYKSSQTPDDLYFSPGNEIPSEKFKKSKSDNTYQDYISSTDDAYLRRKVANRNRWSTIDDFSYWNDFRYPFLNPFMYGFPMWSTWYNPFRYNWGFLGGYPIINGFWGYNSFFGFNNFGHFGWNTYGFFPMRYTNFKYSYNQISNPFLSSKNKTFNNYNTNKPNTSFGSLMRTITSPSGNGYDREVYSRPQRSFDNGTRTFSAPMNSGGFRSVGSSAGSSRGGRN